MSEMNTFCIKNTDLWALNTTTVSGEAWDWDSWDTSHQTSWGAGGLEERNGARSMSLRHISCQ